MSESLVSESLMPENLVELSLREVCERCNVHAERVIALVEYGVVEPMGESYAQWRFSARSYLTLRKALRLQRDLSINEPGVAMVIELLEQLRESREEVEHLSQRLARWEQGESV